MCAAHGAILAACGAIDFDDQVIVACRLLRAGAGEVETALATTARLLFVAMTRASRELHLLHARTRSGAVSHRQLHGPDGRNTLAPSRFLAASPPSTSSATARGGGDDGPVAVPRRAAPATSCGGEAAQDGFKDLDTFACGH